MKKILLLLLTISYFSLSSFAQNTWERIYFENNIMVETTTIECNPNNRMVPYSYVVLRYTNTSSELVTFNFELDLWYNGVLQEKVAKDSGDFPILKSLTLQPNETIEGNCKSEMDYLRVFGNNNYPEMPSRLTKLEIKEI